MKRILTSLLIASLAAFGTSILVAPLVGAAPAHSPVVPPPPVQVSGPMTVRVVAVTKRGMELTVRSALESCHLVDIALVRITNGDFAAWAGAPIALRSRANVRAGQTTRVFVPFNAIGVRMFSIGSHARSEKLALIPTFLGINLVLAHSGVGKPWRIQHEWIEG